VGVIAARNNWEGGKGIDGISRTNRVKRRKRAPLYGGQTVESRRTVSAAERKQTGVHGEGKGGDKGRTSKRSRVGPNRLSLKKEG